MKCEVEAFIATRALLKTWRDLKEERRQFENANMVAVHGLSSGMIRTVLDVVTVCAA